MLLLFAAGPISTLFGLPGPGVAWVVGGLLLVYAAALLWNGSRPAINRGEALLAVVLNAAWVVGSIAVITLGPLTLVGNWAVAVAMEEFPNALHLLAIALAFAGAWTGARGTKLFLQGVRYADDAFAALWIVRGIRGIVVAVAAGALASGLLFAQTWLIVFGVIFLAEELYETGVLALILRAGLR